MRRKKFIIMIRFMAFFFGHNFLLFSYLLCEAYFIVSRMVLSYDAEEERKKRFTRKLWINSGIAREKKSYTLIHGYELQKVK